jgi:cation transport ATPase
MTMAGIAMILVFFQTSVADEFIKEAAIINQDMTQNKTYGPNRYDLGITDYTPLGMAMAFPSSVVAGMYRPFLWESLSVSLILNGIESIVLMYFTFRFFVSGKIRERIKRIRNHEFLIYAFFFALILAYFAGFTSILFGVLVRFKAPVLPFLVMVLTAHYLEEKKNEQLTIDN